MTLTLGFSPCPNDTFIFDALVHQKINTQGLRFEVCLEDVETLNRWALEDKLDISKISYGVWPMVMERYHLLDAGGALGKGVGPLLIAKKAIAANEIDHARIAIPGEHTTAHLLFSLAYPHARHKEFMVFSDIETAVLEGRVDCGVIIHENRFTYRQKGLVKLIDLGQYWETRTGCPIPLGGIILRKELVESGKTAKGAAGHSELPPGEHTALTSTLNMLIRKSLEYAFANYPALPDYVRQHAQEMDETVMRQHIDLYVNDYSLALGNDGKQAVRTLVDIAKGRHQPA